jgi:phosphoribosylamine--glycine ligase
MRILVIGGGGREHALCWRLFREGHELVAAPGNPGIAGVAECVAVAIGDIDALVELAVHRAVDLVVVGPEAPLTAGIADRLRARGVSVFGPGAAAAQLEGSKIFAKEFFARHGIRSAPFRACASAADLEHALTELGPPLVVKADGLAAGKGVMVCDDVEQARAAGRAMLEGRLGVAGRRLLVERRIFGQELSLMALTDGKRLSFLAPVEDHKAVHDGDRGPNTGGMGTASPAAWAEPQLCARIEREIFAPTLAGLARDGHDYRGVLYAGLMVDREGAPWLLEYNCRFGDPETQPVMVRLRGELAAYLAGAAAGALPRDPFDWDARSAVCVVLAASGYPGEPRIGDAINGLDALIDAEKSGEVWAFHAGTRLEGGRLVTAAGRVLGVTALGDDLEAARRRAYRAIDAVHFEGMHFRRDIGARKAKP